VQIAAPAEVNLTKLPALVNYTVVVKNVGAAAARVEVDGESRELGPGQVWRVEKAINATSAGEYRAAVVVNGKKYEKVVAVRYYEARLVAEPVAINVTKLPQNITVTARVKNVGNLTARLDGVEIPPGAAALVNKTLYVDAAGSYVIRLGLLEIPVKVGYLHAACGAEVEAPAEVEVVPGEAVAYRVVVKNTGNTTAICVVDNKPYRLAPGEAAALTKSLTVETAGSYRAEVEINGTTYRREITAKVIKIFVWFKLKSPRETSYGTTPFTEIIYSDSPQASVEYVWRISTNATRRTVTVVIDGRGYAVEPGKSLEIEGRASIDKTGEIYVYINGTKYTAKIELKPREPVVEKTFTKMWFKDTIKKGRQIIVQGVPIYVTTHWITASVTYGDVISISGEAYIEVGIGGFVKLKIEATASGGKGRGTAVITKSETRIRPGTKIDYQFTYSDGRVTSIDKVLVNGTEVPQEYLSAAKALVDILPPVLMPPPTGL
jgi:archaellum component FlaG (FlaF/FlaG flagellin family)